MKRKISHFLAVTVLFLVMLLGFSHNDKNPKNNTTSQTKSNVSTTVSTKKVSSNLTTDYKGGQNQVFGSPFYTDNFDGLNDTTSLKSRGYKVYRNGTFTGATTAIWFQGGAVFDAFNGPPNGHVAANYNAAGTAGDIDNWLVLPRLNVAAGDSVFFYSRSPDGSTFPDSIRVYYSAAGDSTVSGTYVELGRFEVTIAGAWERRGFSAPSAGPSARFVIRYNVVNGGFNGSNSDYIGIDALTVEAPTIANDCGSLSVDNPVGSIGLPTPTIAPRATFKNFGLSNQTNVPVRYSISGPVNYVSNKIISSLTAGASQQVVFDSTFNPTGGTYNVTIISNLATDGNRRNDTLRTSFTVVQTNFGSNGGYFFANSTSGASGAPSQPGYCRLDTSGSTNLARNSTLVKPLRTGTLDDGHWSIPTGIRKVKFMGRIYDSVYVGTNGIIGFINFVPGGGNWNPPSTGLPGNGSGGVTRPAVYPLWMDMDWGSFDQTLNRLSYKIDGAKNRLVITYDRAPLFGGSDSDFVTFQAVLELQPDTAGVPNSRILFGYDNSSTALNVPFLVGLQDSTGTNWVQYSFHDGAVFVTPGPLFDANSSGLAVEFGPNANNLTGFCKQLNLTFRLQAIQLTRRDIVEVELRQAASPFAFVDVATGIYDSTNGVVELSYGVALNGVNYYFKFKHRNSIPTWSAATISLSNSYNLTTNVCQAFGCNQILVNADNKGVFASVYSGDVTDDGCVDVSDIVAIYNDVSLFVGGPYVLTDLNFDEFVDVTDLLIAYNNSVNFVCEAAP